MYSTNIRKDSNTEKPLLKPPFIASLVLCSIFTLSNLAIVIWTTRLRSKFTAPSKSIHWGTTLLAAAWAFFLFVLPFWFLSDEVPYSWMGVRQLTSFVISDG